MKKSKTGPPKRRGEGIVPFNYPFIIGNELQYIEDAVKSGAICGNGKYTRKCQSFLQQYLHRPHVLLTTSCTDALEMAALLSGISRGDEVIVPSFGYVTTANAFALRGAKIVFSDIRKDTLNLDEQRLEELITDRTKAIVLIHYAGVACEMNTIMEIAHTHHLLIVEDAAQALGATYKGQKLGTIGDFGAFSFHETKNVICGEGGALSVNNSEFAEQAYIVWEKGTNRRVFSLGLINKYEWVGLGSSFVPSDILAAFLFAQLEHIRRIMTRRSRIFKRYMRGLRHLQQEGYITLPTIPENCDISYHLFYILTESNEVRDSLIAFLKSQGITAVFHYPPLHSSPFGSKYGCPAEALPVTNKVSGTIVRLPYYYELTEDVQDYVIEKIHDYFHN